jgi:BASS family bile acid:Na+ symporter
MLLLILETAVPLVAFLLMVAVGLDVSRADLRRLAADRRLVLAASLAQATMLPAAALLLTRTFAPSAQAAEYVLLLAACPGGGMSNVYVYLARANTALSVSLTAISCLLAIFTMPLVVLLYELVLDRPLGFALPLPTLFAQLLIMAVIPVSLGAWIRDRYPTLESRYGRHLRTLSAAGVVVIVAIGMAQSAGAFSPEIVAAGVIATLLAVAGMAAGWALGRMLRAAATDRFTLLVEFAVRNLAIAMVIEVSLLHRAEFVPFGALALLGQAGLLGIAVRMYRARQ